jgi:HlyD family secretion protein
MKKILIALGLVAIALGIPIWMSLQRVAAESPSPRINSDPATSTKTSIVSIHGIGFVEPVTEVRKLVFKINGVISRCPAEIGRSYKKGDVLVELDSREQSAEITLAEAELKLAEADRDKVLSGISPDQINSASLKVEVLKEQVRYWTKDHERFGALATSNSVTHSEYDKSYTTLSQKRIEFSQAEADLRHLQQFVREEDRKLAEAKVLTARARLDLSKARLADSYLLAPFDGMVLELMKREGEGSRLFDTEPVVIFGDSNHLRVRAEVDERFVSKIQTGQKAIVSGRGLGDKEYSGRVMLIKRIMGKKTMFARSATERKDLDVVQVMVEMPVVFFAPIGLEVDIKIATSIVE